MREDMMERLLPESIGPAAHVEKAALYETQMVLGERAASAVVGLAAAALVFACLPERSAQVVSLLRTGGVWLAMVLCVLSLGFWWRFFRACVRLKALGLYRRPRGIRASWTWELSGALVGLAIEATICAALGWKLPGVGAGALPGLLTALWLGRRLNQIPDYETAREEDLQKTSIFEEDK
ncbi:MAG: hypothetical protein JNN08_09170 [Bryobacterales bacterium]|nr:hypothetical protein [Bryobacterales bacterium]